MAVRPWRPWRFLALGGLGLLCALSPDEGYDLLLLDMPHRVVMKDRLRFDVRGRPGNMYVVFGDAGNGTTVFGNVHIHLDLGPSLFVAAAGSMPAGGSVPHDLPIPDAPQLGGTVLHFQAFAVDAGVLLGIAASDGKQVTVHRDRGQPLIRLLTVNGIPRDQNGSERGEGTIAVPRTGFTVDLRFDDRGRGRIDPTSLVVTADRPLARGAIPAGSNLAPFFTVTATGASGLVDSTWEFPPERCTTLTASVANDAGIASPIETFTLESMPLTLANRPFGTRQLWFVDFDAHDLDGSGVPDFREDLVLFGLGTDAAATTGPSAEVDRWIRAETIALLESSYGAGGPDPVDVAFFSQRPRRTHARICVGGRNPSTGLPPGAQETTGTAFLNPRNQRKDLVNCYEQLGVHPRSIYHLFRAVPAFQAVFGPLLANPVGNDPEDPIVTAPGFDPGTATTSQRRRYEEILDGVLAFARAVAFVLAQETGHSMGLVAIGTLQGGMLGSFQWGHSTGGHFDDGQGNFMSGNNSTPAPAQPANLALIWDHFQSGRAHFTPLNWAYLRERVIHK